MDYKKERQIKIDIIESIQLAEEDAGFELNASQEAELAEIIFNKLQERLK
jgi:hypothetical protein